jgi:hypothetical protein
MLMQITYEEKIQRTMFTDSYKMTKSPCPKTKRNKDRESKRGAAMAKRWTCRESNPGPLTNCF